MKLVCYYFVSAKHDISEEATLLKWLVDSRIACRSLQNMIPPHFDITYDLQIATCTDLHVVFDALNDKLSN